MAEILLWLVIAGYIVYLLLDLFRVARTRGKTLIAVRLRRRYGDTLLLLAGLTYGLYRTWQDKTSVLSLLPLLLLLILVLITAFRPNLWRLQADGFFYLMKFVPYARIAQMQLRENGVLWIRLDNGTRIDLVLADMDELEKAAAFFSDAAHLDRILTQDSKEIR